MRGTCYGCNASVLVENLPGYNVRLGEVTEAVCTDCLRRYMNPLLPLPRGWFSVILQHIMREQEKNATNVTPIRRG